MREFSTGATRDDDTEKLDFEGFLSPLVLHRYAQYMHEHRKQADGKMRDSDNWQKGMPEKAYMKSLWRHFMDVWMIWREHTPKGKIWEDTLCAVLFNVQGLLFEALRKVDVPAVEQPEVLCACSVCKPYELDRTEYLADEIFTPKGLASYQKKTSHTPIWDSVDPNLGRI